MEIMKDNFCKKLKVSTFVALGSFDGIHLGHKKLIEKAIDMTRKYNENHDDKSKSMVCTFYNHPLTIINKDIAPKLVIDNSCKIKILEELGVDIINFMTFNESFMKISPQEFIEKLVNAYNVKGIIVGFNFRFGYKNLGDISLLEKYSKLLGFELFIVKPVKLCDEIISSTKIRNYIKEGKMEKANEMLGRPFKIEGEVIKGRQIGRTMGFPTINLSYDSKFVIPKRGVYYTLVKYNNEIYKAMTNIGYNPTVNGENLNIETNILDFNENLYGKKIEIFFIHKIRDEKNFGSIENLMKQLNKDRNFVKNQNIKLNIK